MGKNVTKPFQAEFMKNLQKGKILTEPIEAKPFSDFYKLQNESYLETRYYKTNSLNKTHVFYALFTKRCVAKIRWGSLPLAKGETEGFWEISPATWNKLAFCRYIGI